MVKPTERRVGYGVAFGYGITVPFAEALSPLSAPGCYFFTPPLRIIRREAGSIFAIARVIDAVISPIMG